MPDKPSINRTRILYVEDNVDTSEMVSLILSGSEYEVVVRDSVSEALETVRNGEFAVYIIDHSLVDGYGLDLCKEIRKFDSTTPIIFCSGYVDDEQRKRALDGGAQAFLSKPFEPSDLLSLIEVVARV